MSVKLWPLPTTFTLRPLPAACLTMPASSCSLVGRWMATGCATWLPAQFLQVATEVVIVLPAPGPSSGLERLDQLREHLVDVTDDAEVGDPEDRRLLVLVDGDDV